MAVQSRPSLRSSSRRNVSPEGVPPTDTQPDPVPKTRRGKRPRDSSLGSENNTSIKKHKPTPPKKTGRSEDGRLRNRALKSLPLRDKALPQDAVTSRPPDPPPQRINCCTTITSSTTKADNAQSAIQTHSLTIDSASIVNGADKRSLRSHDGGSRTKSELALYFPNYDELVSIEPKEPDFLIPETLLHITDEPSKSKPIITYSSSNHNHAASNSRSSSAPYPITANGSAYTSKLSEATFTNLNDATRLDFSSIDKSTRHQKDPLSDAFYLKAHRRAERQEKQLRNIEKERAMHEKVQLERLMDGLKGHDWLRVMGISGITDSEKKAYEPKREYFIQEVRVLLKKFQEWKEEEKRRKVEKEESMQDEDEDPDDDDEAASGESDGDPPDYTDVDASAARQLQHEAVLATKPARSHHKKHVLSGPSTHQKPFTSFFSKPYLREAAISKHRRGRARYAFGQPLPEPEDRDFELGCEILTAETLAAQERKRTSGRS